MNPSSKPICLDGWKPCCPGMLLRYVTFRFDGGLFNSIQADRNLYKSNESINPIGSISVNEDERRKLVWVLLIWRWVVCCCCCCDLLLWLGIAGTNAKGGRVGLPTRSRSTGSSWLIRKRGIRQWVMSSDIKVHQQAIVGRVVQVDNRWSNSKIGTTTRCTRKN